MKFGFDIDDTLINLREYAFHLYNEKLNKNIDITIFHDLDTVEIHEPFELTNEEGKKLWDSLREDIYFKECPPFPFAVEIVNELVKNGHEVFYITARKIEFAERTKQWMKDVGFPIEDNHFYCGMEDHEKIHIIHDLKLDYYFDDKPAVLETLQDSSVQLFVKNQSYNRTYTWNRIHDWSELRQLIIEEA